MKTPACVAGVHTAFGSRLYCFLFSLLRCARGGTYWWCGEARFAIGCSFTVCSCVFLSSQIALVRLNRALKNVEVRRKPSIRTGPCWSSAWGLAFVRVCLRVLSGRGPWPRWAARCPSSAAVVRAAVRRGPSLSRCRAVVAVAVAGRCRAVARRCRPSFGWPLPCRRRAVAVVAALRVRRPRFAACWRFLPSTRVPQAHEAGTVNRRKTYGRAR